MTDRAALTTVAVVDDKFRATRRRVVGDCPWDDTPDDAALYACGWTTERYETIEALPGVSGLTVLLGHQAERMTLSGAAWDDVLPWLQTLASEGRTAGHVSALITSLETLRWEDVMGRTGVPGRLEALAFAAGLTPEEAVENHAEGALDPAVLRTVATLSGFMLPASL